MKITAARKREDIIRDRDAYDSKYAAAKEIADKESRDFKRALNDVTDAVKFEIEDALSSVTDLDLEVIVSPSWRETGLEVRVNSNQNNVHGEDKALSWDYRAQLNKEGEVERETGSWSGLQAVTSVQLESLKKSVAALEILNSLDWKDLLGRAVPQWDEYIKTDPRVAAGGVRPNFERELEEADIDEAIESGSWIKGHGYKWYRSSATVYYKVFKETPTMYEVAEVWENNMNREDETSNPQTYKIKKDVFFQLIDKPLQLKEA